MTFGKREIEANADQSNYAEVSIVLSISNSLLTELQHDMGKEIGVSNFGLIFSLCVPMA